MKTRHVEFLRNKRLIGYHSLPGDPNEPVYVATSLCNSEHQLSVIKHTVVLSDNSQPPPFFSGSVALQQQHQPPKRQRRFCEIS
jgi:hypothetical protein